jgi:hypothetical protein
VLPVTFTQTNADGYLSGLGTVNAVNGVATLVVTGSRLGRVLLTASSTGLPGSGTQAFDVVMAPATITFPAPTTGGVFGTSFTASPTSWPGSSVSLEATGGCSAEPTDGHYAVTMTSGTTPCHLTASLGGDTNHFPAPPVTDTVNAARAPQADPALDGPASAAYGDTIDVTAEPTPTTGTVTFSVPSGSCDLGDSTATDASVTITHGSGDCTIDALYTGDANYIGGTAQLVVPARVVRRRGRRDQGLRVARSRVHRRPIRVRERGSG